MTDDRHDASPLSRLRPGPAPHSGSRPMKLEPWELTICDDLTDKQVELIENIVELPRRSSGIIWFNSCGGSVYAGLALATLIRLRGLRATAVVAGECSSAALLPFAACQMRFVTPHATMLFHPIRWTGEEDMRLEDAAEWARHFAALESDIDRLLIDLFSADPAGLDPEAKTRQEDLSSTIKSWTRPGRFVSGSELVESKLAKMLTLANGDLWQQMAKLAGQ